MHIKRNKNALIMTIIALTLISLYSCAQSQQITTAPVLPKAPFQWYESLPDKEQKKTFRGILRIENIAADTAFDWYNHNLKAFTIDSAVVQAIRPKVSKIHVVIFGGTWCDDTHQLLPKYLSLLQAANFPDDHLTLVTVDHKKQTLGGLNNVFHITNVPTCIVMKDGKEIGRIIEYGKNGFVDKELGEIVSGVE